MGRIVGLTEELIAEREAKRKAAEEKAAAARPVKSDKAEKSKGADTGKDEKPDAGGK